MVIRPLPMKRALRWRADFSPLQPRTVDPTSGLAPTLKRDESRVPSLPLVLDLVLSKYPQFKLPTLTERRHSRSIPL